MAKTSNTAGQPTAEEGAVPNPENKPVRKGVFRDWFEVIMYGLAILMFLTGYSFQNFQIPTSSMENNLLIGDHLTANKFIFSKPAFSWEKKLMPIRDLKRGDVIVFKYPRNTTQDYIKRLIGMPGDRFEIVNDQVMINGSPLEEPYPFYKKPFSEMRTQKRKNGNKDDDHDLGDRDPENAYRPLYYDTMKPGLEHAQFLEGKDYSLARIKAATFHSLRNYFKNSDERDHYMKLLREAPRGEIPEDFYLMMGDNRNRSADSREWGLVPRALIEGRAHFVWWSYGEDEGSHKLKGLDLVMSYLRVPFTFWTRTHWEESFSLIR